jgi:hypothetical protein
MTAKEKLASWCKDHPNSLNNELALRAIQSSIPHLEVKRLGSKALGVRFSANDSWIDIGSWYANYQNNCVSRVQEEMDRVLLILPQKRKDEFLSMLSDVLEKEHLPQRAKAVTHEDFLRLTANGLIRERQGRPQSQQVIMQFVQLVEKDLFGVVSAEDVYLKLINKS